MIVMKKDIQQWKDGVKDGIPICLGYFAVSFTFGIMARNAGLTPLQAVVMSGANFTSAGQFAALGLIGASSTFVEMAMTQLILNLRYCLMSCSLSQKLDERTSFLHRFLVAHGVSDEIFGVSVCRNGKLNPLYNYGLMSIALPGWVMGTFCGVVSGGILPERMISAMGIVLYSMFLALVIPPARDNKLLGGIVLLSMLASLLFAKLPMFEQCTSGVKIVGLTMLIAGMAAYLFPRKEESHG